MNHPSLIYLTSPEQRPLDPAVFDDLQLTQLIPQEVFSAVLSPCGLRDLPARQAMFRAMEQTPFEEHMQCLSALISEICRLDRILGEADCDAERAFCYAAVCLAVVRFSEKASETVGETGDNPLFARFRAAFSERVSEAAFSEVRMEAEKLSALSQTLAPVVISSHQRSIRVTAETGKSYLSRICECSANLGLESPELPTFPELQLSPVLITSLVSLHPEEIKAFLSFREKYGNFYEPAITAYRLQFAFYLEMSRLFRRIRENGIPLSYPELTESRGIHITEAYDISLLAKNETHIVPNDIQFTPQEPFYYLTGANGGGKTTYLRTVGIACVFLFLGCPIACKNAVCSVPSGVFTHFPQDERFESTGRFVEENRRVQKILSEMDSDSVVLLNETYSTTNEENAVEMTEKLADRLYGAAVFGLYITHQHSLEQSAIPYLNVVVDLNDSNRRTFRIAKQRTNYGSFAVDILKKYALTKEALTERFGGGML